MLIELPGDFMDGMIILVFVYLQKAGLKLMEKRTVDILP